MTVKPASMAEETMRIAMLLSDEEVLILRTLHDPKNGG
jgi:hypothetical protein